MSKKKEERLANIELQFMSSVHTSGYGFMITQGSLERTRKARQSLEAQLRTMLSALVLYDVTDTTCARKQRFIPNVGFTIYYLVIRKVGAANKMQDKMIKKYFQINSLFKQELIDRRNIFRALLRLFSRPAWRSYSALLSNTCLDGTK